MLQLLLGAIESKVLYTLQLLLGGPFEGRVLNYDMVPFEGRVLNYDMVRNTFRGL